MWQEQQASLGGQTGKTASSKARDKAYGGQTQKRRGRKKDKKVCQRGADVNVKVEKEIKAENRELKRNVYPEKQRRSAEEVYDKFENSTEPGLIDQNLGDQKLD